MALGGLRARQILALLAVVAAIVASSLFLEIAEVTRAAVEESRRDAEYVGQALFLHISDAVAADRSGSPYTALQRDVNLKLTLGTASQYAPTVLHGAFADTLGRVVIHSDTSRVGLPVVPYPPLPRAGNLASAGRFLWGLRGASGLYEVSTPLRIGEQPFGSVHVVLSSAFIESEVRRVLARGLMVGLAQVLMALGAAFFLTRIVVGPLREIRRAVEALRAGDFGYRIPRQGIDEFASLAESLNALGDQFRARQATGTGGRDALRNALDQIGDGLLVVSSDREVSFVNGIAAHHLGIDPARTVGRSLSSIFADGHPLRALVDDVLAGRGDRVSRRAELPRRDGKAGVLAIGHRIEDAPENPGVLVELKDLATMADLQAVVDHSTTLSRLGEMAAGVAHEIRNPLNAMNLSLEPLRHSGTLEPGEVQEAVEDIRIQIARLNRAVNGFLKVARLQRLTMAPLDPGALVREVAGLLGPEATLADLELELRCGGEPPEVVGDVEVLRQALINLVKNAIQALPSRDRRIVLECRTVEGRVAISVRDTGPGIDPAIRPRIFDLYMTTKKGGTGVGLAFVRQAAEMHRGSVEVESAPGEGAAFTLWLRAEAPVGTPRA